MKNKTKAILVVKTFILLALASKSYAQTITKQEKGYFNLTEITAFTGNKALDFQVTPNQFVSSTDGAYAFSLRNINGYFITNKIAVGLGNAKVRLECQALYQIEGSIRVNDQHI